MKSSDHPDFLHYEYRFLKWVQKTLATDWATVRGGWAGRAKVMWIAILRTLELDKKAQVDLFLLAQQGNAGRTEANEILWGLFSDHALRTPYRDLSNN